jgi:hypothetical protein
VLKPYILCNGATWYAAADLEEMIPENHVMRGINEATEPDLSVLMERYKGKASSKDFILR